MEVRLMIARSVALGLLLVLCGAARAGLECAEPVFAAGRVRGGVPLAHEFTLVNSGGTPVEVVEVKPGCGCLRPQLGRRTFAPGERATLRVEVNTLTQAEGPNRWRVAVRYREAGRAGELTLDVTADVVPEVSARPANLVLYTDAAIGHALTLTERRERPLVLTAVRTTSAHVRARAGEARPDGEGHWVRTVGLEVLADCPEGRHEEVLLLGTDDPLYGELKVPFTVVKRARRAVSALPAEVRLVASAGQSPPARVVLLSAADGGEVGVGRVESDSPAVQCRWAPGPGPRATLRVQVDGARLTGGSLEATVRVHLSRPEGVTVTIPVRCLVR
jgi:hypothetical protein